MNMQVETMLKRLPDKKRKAQFEDIDRAISVMYVHGYLSPSAMRKSRDRLVNQIEANWKATKEAENS